MTLRSPFTCVLWDVDGTVVDASEGILRRLAIALEHFGKSAATRDELVHWIGPPMFESFQKNVGMTPEESSEAVSYYRAIGKADGYTTGARLYPGVSELIADLDAAGEALAASHARQLEAFDHAEGDVPRGQAGRRKRLEERHKREARRLRNDALRAGMAALADEARAGAVDAGGAQAYGRVGDALANLQLALLHNAREDLALLAMLLALDASTT